MSVWGLPLLFGSCRGVVVQRGTWGSIDGRCKVHVMWIYEVYVCGGHIVLVRYCATMPAMSFT